MTSNIRRRGVWYCGLAVLLLIVSLFGGGAAPVRADDSGPGLNAGCSVPSDDCWQPGFHVPGVYGTVYAMVWDSLGRIYVGGVFHEAGGLPVNNLAMWDGVTWRDVGGGVTRSSSTPEVNALAIDGWGRLIVGGYFDQAGGVDARNLAVWNGSTWQELGGGVNGEVRAIEMVSGGMYLGGSFNQVGSGALSARHIAYYDFQTSSWSALGQGVFWENYYYGDGHVNAIELEPTTNSLFVGGSFGTAGASVAVGIARYDLTSKNWYSVGGGLRTLGGTINALMAVPRSGGYYLYVGGEFPQVGETGSAVEAHNIARWDGSAWSAMAYGTDDPVNAIAITNSGDVLIGGSFTSAGPSGSTVQTKGIARWNGSGWSALGSGVDGSVYAMLFDGSDLIVGGRFDLAGQKVVGNLARWNGSDWSSMDGGLGVYNVVDVLLADNGAVYAAGSITHFGSLQATGLAKFNGSTWIGEGSPASLYIRALVKPRPDLIYAGGAFTTIGGASAKYLAQWNGVGWSELGGGTNGYVNALALDGNKLYVGGEFTQVGGGTPAKYIAMWDGVYWNALGQGLDGYVRALAVDGSGNLYAAGEFNYAGSLFVGHIARWDGSQWHALGSGLCCSKYVETLTFDGDGRLYVGGYFGYAGDLRVNGVAMWNGLEWSALGSGMNDGVGSLVVDANGYLYAGGDFNTAGGVAANHVARWDGFVWSPLGSGTDSNVFALALGTDYLMAGGVFKSAGGKAATYIAAYRFPLPEFAPAPTLNSLSPANTIVGGGGFWLTVNGSNFSSRSQVRWNGTPLITTYRGANQLRAYVPADKVATAGTASILVFTPAPNGGGASFALPFEVLSGSQVYLPMVVR